MCWKRSVSKILIFWQDSISLNQIKVVLWSLRENALASSEAWGASPFACRWRVTSRDSPNWKACSQANNDWKREVFTWITSHSRILMLMSISNSAIVLSVCNYNKLNYQQKGHLQKLTNANEKYGRLTEYRDIGVFLVFNTPPTGADFSGERSTKQGRSARHTLWRKATSPSRHVCLALLARFALAFSRLKKLKKIMPTFCRIMGSKHLSQLSSLAFTKAMRKWLKDQMLLWRINPLRICANTKLITNLFHLSCVDSKVCKMLSKIRIFYHVIFIIRKYICKTKYTPGI